MDELITNERACVLMIENIVDGGIQFGVLVRRHVRQIARAIHTGRQLLSIQQGLCTNVIRSIRAGVVAERHRTNIVRRVYTNSADSHRGRRNDPAGEDSCEGSNFILPISWYAISICVQDWSAIRIQHVGPDRKQLHQLSRVIFIRRNSRIAGHVQVKPHARIQRFIEKQLSIISERILVDSLQIRRVPTGLIRVEVASRDHDYLV